MKKSNLLKSAGIGAAMIAMPALASGQTADSDSAKIAHELDASRSSIEYRFAANGGSKARINLLFGLPFLKTDVYSFMEFYGEGGYFGKDMIYTPVLQRFGAGIKAETKHAYFPNPAGDPIKYNTIGFGFEKWGTLPGGITASIKFLPLVLGKNGIEESAILGYFANKTIVLNKNLDINISSFLDFDIAGNRSDYGETDAVLAIKTKRGQWDVGVGVNHNVSGKMMPDNQVVAKLGYHIKK